MYNPLSLLKNTTTSTTTTTTTTVTPSPHACPTCGAEGFGLRLAGKDVDGELEYQRRIADLEAQVKILSDKATAAADKLADYEDEIQRLKRTSPSKGMMIGTPPQVLATPPPTTTLSPSGRISNFLSITTRRGAGPPSPPIDPSESRPSSASSNSNIPITELEKALTTEKTLRQQAEGKLQDVTNELEELSASLFQQANEMVADERRARSKLEARIVLLEKRDKDKVERLGRLEGAVDRINRVKDLLVTTPTTMPEAGVRSNS
ncbi:hypothetical protein DFH27DRAFT_474959 [Peziza echinospora]|nr:hypothetical protein DFH27DRAFT_474959 [Peziza echinospora]